MKNRQYTLKELGIWMIIVGLLLLYAGPGKSRSETIETAEGFLGPCYSVHKRRSGFELLVTLDGAEYRLDGDYIEQPIGDLERQLDGVITYHAEVVYVSGPNLKPHLLGLTVGNREYVAFDEVYANWQKNNRLLGITSIPCLAGGILACIFDGRRKRKKDAQE